MSPSETRLDPTTHADVFAEKIIPVSGLSQATSQAQPKAILLAGQPGAGKGGLARQAEIELANDLVKIDPDALRDFRPGVDALRAANPYTWSGLTHTDASQWADKLLDATVSGKKNLIFDSALSNGEWSSELIRDLQAKGYEVEVRAIAAHKLESEWGVDYRFSKSVDQHGFGRHVPADKRDAIYDRLPSSLDMIHDRTDAPIRIFNREGAELYDSRVDARQPGAALETARNTRLKDPAITRVLSESWNAQQSWHRDLPEALARNPKVEAPTAQRLLTERSEQKVVEQISHYTEKARGHYLTTRVASVHDHLEPKQEAQPVNDATIEQRPRVNNSEPRARDKRAALMNSERPRRESRGL
ncbi:zeta toxin family protein [Rhizobium binae]|uniref:zeta toxin family protein n=1 Tax=Rhizobium binae TaxID=1138190 RepID=UPI001C8393D0|nr:zeta toxin family protein [Rhizobium binae]MBX4967755.1 zeta toxin family protein [Rhizobium binae]